MCRRVLCTPGLLLSLLALPASAAAQGPEAGVGYSFIRVMDGGSVNMPAGFIASVANGTGDFSFVGEVGGNYKSAGGVLLQVYTFQAGPRFTDRNKRGAQPYVEFQFGAMYLRVLGQSSTKFTIEPAAGLDIPFRTHKKIKARIGIGVPFIFASNENLHALRIHGGFVFAMHR